MRKHWRAGLLILVLLVWAWFALLAWAALEYCHYEELAKLANSKRSK
jgi:hypothetical protein